MIKKKNQNKINTHIRKKKETDKSYEPRYK